MLLRVSREFTPLPLYVTENGATFADYPTHDGRVHDPERVHYLAGYTRGVADAVGRGADVRGYFAWSFLDNFEWSWGYSMRFGIVYVDYPTQARIPKDSAYWYRDFIAAQGRAADAASAPTARRRSGGSIRTDRRNPRMTASTDHLRPLLDRLTLEEKVALVQGADFWTTVPLPQIGLRAMTLSDGPRACAARCGTSAIRRSTSRRRPRSPRRGTPTSPTATARPRHPRPVARASTSCSARPSTCTARRSAAATSSASARTRSSSPSSPPPTSRGCRTTASRRRPKHYVANDSETDRFTVDVRVDERALRELYLLPFERDRRGAAPGRS